MEGHSGGAWMGWLHKVNAICSQCPGGSEGSCADLGILLEW
jgi:hypothetical protein